MSVVDRLIGLASPDAALRRAIRLIEQKRTKEAYPLLQLAAKAGLPEAEYRVARAYLDGTGVPASQIEGVRWLERAANHGSPEAQSLLGALYVHGLAAPSDGSAGGASHANRLFTSDLRADPDFAAAIKWARKAADAGSAQGQALLAYILTYGPEEMRDPDSAERLYQQSASAGCPEGNLGYALALSRHATDETTKRKVVEHLTLAADAKVPSAIYLLGVMTEQGLGTDPNPQAAAQLYREAAERGHRLAQVNWGRALLEGRYVSQDLVTGESWLRRAALAGEPEAANLVGDLYAQGGTPNYVEAATWYQRAALAGHQGAARALASLYFTGAGVAQDEKEATRWLRVAAESGDPTSRIDLANLVLRGIGDQTDPMKIAGWFQQAADSGDLFAAYNLGLCLEKGVGVRRDEQQAMSWFRHAAEGIPQAQYMYGKMLAEARDTTADLEAARIWYARAAEAGVADAQVDLAEMMVNGRGGPRDPMAALKLFDNAARNGHAGAMFALGALHGGGHGLPADPKMAFRWFRAAAEKGHGHAQLMVGRYLAHGIAGEPNPVEARLWLERAAAQGVDEAERDLGEVAVPTSA